MQQSVCRQVAAPRRSHQLPPPLPPPQAAQGDWAEAFEAERQGLLRGAAGPITPQLVLDELRRQGGSCRRPRVVHACCLPTQPAEQSNQPWVALNAPA